MQIFSTTFNFICDKLLVTISVYQLEKSSYITNFISIHFWRENQINIYNLKIPHLFSSTTPIYKCKLNV